MKIQSCGYFGDERGNTHQVFKRVKQVVYPLLKGGQIIRDVRCGFVTAEGIVNDNGDGTFSTLDGEVLKPI
ncbi:hypothetical protein VQ7734_03642 [Vibrio quintilis]|uniref:Uncharacterized protein n=1 Tax=Vibrio quintilis TaxID=1117707 RepID=A0A1M7YZ92_9VIBR|nr:hypothetical protein VQ7734_03642 [Vibrio quintilis]